MRFERELIFPTRSLVAVALLVTLAALTGCGTGGSWNTIPTGPPLSYLTLTPQTDTLQFGQTRAFVAAAYDTDSVAVSSPSLDWTSTNPLVASVSSTGLVTALAEGVTQVIATGNGAADTATVFVYTQDGWFVQTSNTANALNAVWFVSDGRRGAAVGASGTLLTTADAGVTWTQRTSGTGSALNSVCFTTHSDTAWAVGASGVVLKSVNGGATWTRQTQVTATENLTCVRFVGTRNGWIVGNGVVLRTTNGGLTWTRTSPTAQLLNTVAFSDAVNGWAAGAGGLVLGTHDGGGSWYVVQPALTAQAFQAAARRSNTAGWLVGAQGTVARTSATVDSLQWSVASTGAQHQLNGLAMASATEGWAVGFNGTAALILYTDDAGASWSPQSSIATESLNDVYFVDAQRGWAVGANGRILHTARGGR